MYNKRNFNKVNDKKVLHKVKKQWVTISLALFMMIGGGAVATHINASADTINNQKVVNVQTQNKKSTTVTDQASQLHNRLVNDANVQALRLGSNHAKRNNILRNRFKRSNNGKSLKKSGYVNTTKYHGHFVFNKYAPNDKRAIVPKRLNLKHLNWAKGRFGRLNLTLFAHKRYGWIKLSNRNAKKYTKALNGIYKDYKKSKRTNHSKRSHVTYISARNYKKLSHQLKNYQYSMRHGYKWNRKYNKKAYYNLKNRMKHLRIHSTKRKNRRNNKKQIKNNKKTSSNTQQATPVSFSGDNNTNQTNQLNNTSDQPSQSNSDINTQQSQSDQNMNTSSDNIVQPSDNSDSNSQPSDTTPTSGQIAQNIQQAKQQTLNDINQERQQNGVAPLIESPTLDKLSALRAQQLTTNFDHYNSQGQFYGTVDAPQVGLHPGFDCAENIAENSGSDGADAANSANSDMMYHDQDQGNGHRYNILDPTSQYVGIGVAYQSDSYYIAEDFLSVNSDNGSGIPDIKSDEQQLVSDQNQIKSTQNDIRSSVAESDQELIQNDKDIISSAQEILNSDKGILQSNQSNKDDSQIIQRDNQDIQNAQNKLQADQNKLQSDQKKMQTDQSNIQNTINNTQYIRNEQQSLQQAQEKLQADEQYVNYVEKG